MEDKFKDIKEGDKVLLPVVVGLGFSRSKTFYLEKTVEKVTKTQFAVDGRRFQKRVGHEIGGSSYTYTMVKHLSEGEDQEMDFIAFKEKLSLFVEVKNLLSSFRIPDIDNVEEEELVALKNILNKLGKGK